MELFLSLSLNSSDARIVTRQLWHGKLKRIHPDLKGLTALQHPSVTLEIWQSGTDEISRLPTA
ncbi:hypothetical protein CU103_14030 [Phyllobacterium sophorae]|uniref:Uncharacterized protein n=1 Tax=Phyllobacterium sophorae TaxID=1520277 RepID=A0A2P7BCF2_9HYPH|nr:hypothetical protein CU103_14030 [Phyllobacterium sophorae]